MYVFVVVWSVCIFVAALGSLAHLEVIVTEETTTLEAARNIFTVAAGFIAFPMALYGMHMKREDLQLKRDEAEKTLDEDDIGEDEGEESQIAYIRDLVSTSFKEMISATDLPPPEEGHVSIPADVVRFGLFRNFEAKFEVAIISRTSALGSIRKADLQLALTSMKQLMNDLEFANRRILPLATAASFYTAFQELGWLELPSGTPASS